MMPVVLCLLRSKLLRTVFISSVLASCVERPVRQMIAAGPMEYATGFSFKDVGPCTELVVGGGADIHRYLLVPEGAQPCDREGYTVIRTPVRKVVLSGTTQLPWIEALGVSESLAGFPDPRLIFSKAVTEQVLQGSVVDAGGPSGLDPERILSLKPDVVFSYPSKANREEWYFAHGIPVLITREMEETHPLGRAEWIRLTGLLYGKEREADSVFRFIRDRYLTLSSAIKSVEPAPTVITGIPYGGVWFMPGGRNFITILFRDAGFDYLWKEDSSTGTLRLGFEPV